MKQLTITFYGTRGSLPTPSTTTFSTTKYGGNTTCMEINNDLEKLLIVDAGTGIKELTNSLQERKRQGDAAMLFSHPHWDHIQGFPFFGSMFNPNNTFTTYSAEEHVVEDALQKQMSEPCFPITMDAMKAETVQRPFSIGEQLHYGPYTINTAELQHPGKAVSYAIQYEGRKIVVVADHEHGNEEKTATLQKHAREADVIVYDAQYLPEEYRGEVGINNGFPIPRQGWGHSTYEQGVDFALAVHAKQLVLTHHDPGHDDVFLDGLERRAKQYLKARTAALDIQSNLEVYLAREGMHLAI